MSEGIALAAAIFSAVAAAFAALATWRAPIAAAKLAEALRRDAERAQERRRHKLELFSTLMQERAAIYSDKGARALNVVDVVFAGSRAVREAWADLFHGFEAQHGVPPHSQNERLRKLLEAMAQDIGMAEEFRTDDFSRVYFPNALAQENFIKNIERQQAVARIQGQLSPAANAADPHATPFPPTPK